MAAVELTPVKITSAGQAVAWVSASADGHYFKNTGKELILLYADALARIVSIPLAGALIDGESPADKEFTKGTGVALACIGPFHPDYYNYPTTGTYPGCVYFYLSGTTSTYVAVVRYDPYFL